jgi:hypothetical protein
VVVKIAVEPDNVIGDPNDIPLSKNSTVPVAAG